VFRRFQSGLPGYRLCAQVVNAAEYGVPQLRRRAVVFGLHRDFGIEPSLPPPTHGGSGEVFDYRSREYVEPSSEAGRYALKLRPRGTLGKRPLVTVKAAIGDLPRRPVPSEERQTYAHCATSSYQREMRRGGQGLFNHTPWNHRPETVRRLRRLDPGDCPTEFGTRQRNERYFSQAYARLHPDGLARTITTNFHNTGSGRFAHFSMPRSLTIREALRIQSFPDNFIFDDAIALSTAERLVGNAFPRLLARRLGEHLAPLLSD
jgi:DNA (cytosine-5)-methyltransferase 1